MKERSSEDGDLGVVGSPIRIQPTIQMLFKQFGLPLKVVDQIPE
jgi:hypothetical protein